MKFVPRALCAAVLLVAMSGGPVGAQTQVDPHSVATVSRVRTITIQSFSYLVPQHVRAGSKVKVVNKDIPAHTVSADDGSFGVDVGGGGTGYLTAPSKPGSYSFHCIYHGSMHGVLVVKKRR